MNPTPTQPAPVTPPPEPWMVKAAQTASIELLNEVNRQCDNHEGPISFKATAYAKAEACIIRHLNRHAPPPAPSCPTEQGELVERLRLAVAEMRDATLLTANECLIKDSFAALSRQPAPSADAANRPDGSKYKGDGAGLDYVDDLNAYCDGLEVEMARLKEQLENQASIIRDSCTPANEREIRMLRELAQLRAAPSAVAKDRAEVVEQMQLMRKFQRLDSTDAIALLSQPAVAQTEAGNDMTTAERLAAALAEIERFSDIVKNVNAHRGRAGHKMIVPKDAEGRAVYWKARARSAEGDLAKTLTDILDYEAKNSALSESSPQSPSVPAVAGGGEAAAMIARECAMKNIGLEGWEYTDLRSYDRGEVDTLTESILRAISDAVKGSGAVEALDDLLHHGCLISDNGKRHNADPEKAVAALTALKALSLPDHPSTP